MFHRCKTTEQAKHLFRKLALRLHPDQGGDHDLMILLQECFDSHKNQGNFKEPLKYEKALEKVKAGDPRLEIIDDILVYADNHERFDTSFVDSLVTFLETKGYLSSSQYNCLVKLYYSFDMNETEEDV